LLGLVLVIGPDTTVAVLPVPPIPPPASGRPHDTSIMSRRTRRRIGSLAGDFMIVNGPGWSPGVLRNDRSQALHAHGRSPAKRDSRHDLYERATGRSPPRIPAPGPQRGSEIPLQPPQAHCRT